MGLADEMYAACGMTSTVSVSVSCPIVILRCGPIGMRRYREFQYDDNFAPADYSAFVGELHSMSQHYVSRLLSR